VGSHYDDEYVIDAFRRVAVLGRYRGGDRRFDKLSGNFEQMESIYRYFPMGRLATLAILAITITALNGPTLRSQLRSSNVAIRHHQCCGIKFTRLRAFESWDWTTCGRSDSMRQVVPLLKSVAECAVVLSHNPDTVDLPVWDSYEGWILSGHTHGGQCKPPFLRPPLLPCSNRRYTAGEFDLSAGRRMYISRGVGHLLHVRFNGRPEVTIFELRSA
jgi:hypothetical protein